MIDKSTDLTYGHTVAHIRLRSQTNWGQGRTWWTSNKVHILDLHKSAFQIAQHLFILRIQLSECSWTCRCSAGTVCFTFSEHLRLPLHQKETQLQQSEVPVLGHFADTPFKTNKKVRLWSNPIMRFFKLQRLSVLNVRKRGSLLSQVCPAYNEVRRDLQGELSFFWQVKVKVNMSCLFCSHRSLQPFHLRFYSQELFRGARGDCRWNVRANKDGAWRAPVY